jgi:hypothetical protein
MTTTAHSGVEKMFVVKMVPLAYMNTLENLSGMNHMVMTTVCTYINFKNMLTVSRGIAGIGYV